ncbi:MAG: ATP-binding cassette domain-containing protein [Opitutaceae bacterium]|nr:ATP-binding cassette domain-containing protein [Cytophagales bacterium]
MLQLISYKKYYGTRLVLESEKYTFLTGLHWVKGENGSGKTTLFKSLAGILPFLGKIVLNDCSLKEKPNKYRFQVNYAEAEPVFPPMVKGSDLVSLFEKYKGASKSQVEEISEVLDIKFLEEPFSSYSSGMGKKLSLLLAFLGLPKVILLDEPLVTLDVKSVSAMLELITLYQQKYNTSFLISSHQIFENKTIRPDYVHHVENGTICLQV